MRNIAPYLHGIYPVVTGAGTGIIAGRMRAEGALYCCLPALLLQAACPAQRDDVEKLP